MDNVIFILHLCASKTNSVYMNTEDFCTFQHSFSTCKSLILPLSEDADLRTKFVWFCSVWVPARKQNNLYGFVIFVAENFQKVFTPVI